MNFPMNITASVVGAGSRIQHQEGIMELESAAAYYQLETGVTYDYNPLISTNPANGNKGDNSAYYAPYQGLAASTDHFHTGCGRSGTAWRRRSSIR